MNPTPKKHTLPRPTVTLPEPFDDLFGNLESKVLLLTVVCRCAVSKDRIEGYRGVDIVNAIDLLHVEIMEGLRQLQGNFNCL